MAKITHQFLLGKELRVGDTVQLDATVYGCATVYQIKDNFIYMVRPHIHIPDFSGCAKWYTGHHEIKVIADSSCVFEVVWRA